MKSKLKPDTVVGFRLMTGEEIIARVVEQHASYFILAKPITIVQDHTGQMGFQSVPMLVDFEKNVTVQKHGIMMEFTPEAGIIEAYKAETGMIITPNKEIIT